ncbi:MAG: hypothetical protein ACMXYM_01565 [Candidatus Woesearchaeota archaeon]
MGITETQLSELLDLAGMRSKTLMNHIETPITNPKFAGYKSLEDGIKAEYETTVPQRFQEDLRRELSEMGFRHVPLAFEGRQPVTGEKPLDVFRDERQDYVFQLTVHYTNP